MGRRRLAAERDNGGAMRPRVQTLTEVLQVVKPAAN